MAGRPPLTGVLDFIHTFTSMRLDGKRYNEIARELDVSIDTLRIYRGCKKTQHHRIPLHWKEDKMEQTHAYIHYTQLIAQAHDNNRPFEKKRQQHITKVDKEVRQIIEAIQSEDPPKDTPLMRKVNDLLMLKLLYETDKDGSTLHDEIMNDLEVIEGIEQHQGHEV